MAKITSSNDRAKFPAIRINKYPYIPHHSVVTWNAAFRDCLESSGYKRVVVEYVADSKQIKFTGVAGNYRESDMKYAIKLSTNRMSFGIVDDVPDLLELIGGAKNRYHWFPIYPDKDNPAIFYVDLVPPQKEEVIQTEDKIPDVKLDNTPTTVVEEEKEIITTTTQTPTTIPRKLFLVNTLNRFRKLVISGVMRDNHITSDILKEVMSRYEVVDGLPGGNTFSKFIQQCKHDGIEITGRRGLNDDARIPVNPGDAICIVTTMKGGELDFKILELTSVKEKTPPKGNLYFIEQLELFRLLGKGTIYTDLEILPVNFKERLLGWAKQYNLYNSVLTKNIGVRISEQISMSKFDKPIPTKNLTNLGELNSGDKVITFYVRDGALECREVNLIK